MGRIGIVLVWLLAGITSRAVAQSAVLRGTVRSESASLIPGVHVTVAELAVGTSTAASGRYRVSIAEAHVRGQTVHVRFRRDGYRSRIETLVVRAGEHTLDVTLERDRNGIEATVTAGMLDSAPRTAATVAVARVDAVDVPVPGVNPLAQLAGHVAGLGVFSASGRPGTAPDVIVRGMTSLSPTGRSAEPLYVIDGIIVSDGLAAVDPWDIATFELERGSAGASAYGARGANGVITISTKSAGTAAERVTFGVRSEVGMSDVEREIRLARQHALLLSADGGRFCVRNLTQPLCAQTVDWATETSRVNNYPGDWADVPATFAFDPGSATSGAPLRQVFLSNLWPVPTYDPVRQVMIARPYASTGVDATGGIAGARFSASLSRLRQQGAIRYLDGFTRTTARLNVDRRIGSALWLAARSFFSRGLSDGVSQEDGGNLFSALTRQCAACNVLARDTLGRLYARSNIMSQGDQNNNPLLYTAGNGFTDATTTERFIGGGTLRWSPASWADVEANVSYDRSASRYRQYRPSGFRTQGVAWAADPRGFLAYDDYGGETWNGSLSLTLRQTPLRALLVQWHLRYLFERQDTYADAVSGDPLAVGGANTVDPPSLASSAASERLAGLVAGVSLSYGDKLFGDIIGHRDGSWLLDSAAHWASFGRGSLAYRVSQERWWRWTNILNEFKLRASYGSAGSRPRFSTPYEMSPIATGGTLGTPQFTDGSLRPETTTELELGADIELYRRVGVTLTYAHSDTKDQVLPVSIPTATGFGTEWQNAGTLTNKTWELSVKLPLAHTRDLSWSWRFEYDRTRTVITKLDVPPFRMGAGLQGTTDIIHVAEGERYGTIYGRYLLRGSGDCVRLPVPFGADCGTATSAFQVNDDGYLVWVGRDGSGQAFGWRDGLTKNLWMTQLPSASAPWGVALNWGMPITLRDSVTAAAAAVRLGTGLPDWRLSASQTLQYRRLTLYALLEGVVGRSVWNQGRHRSYLDFNNRDVEQRGRDPGVAKPIGYYYRAAPPDNASGINGLYQTMAPSNVTVEDASFAKLRELAITYHVGQVGGAGDWTVSVIGRNVFTLTNYGGVDPEVGIGGGQSSSALVNAVDAYTFPNPRTFTVALSSTF
jgi:TonB-linked SusC/RagA family outer membrane protein